VPAPSIVHDGQDVATPIQGSLVEIDPEVPSKNKFDIFRSGFACPENSATRRSRAAATVSQLQRRPPMQMQTSQEEVLTAADVPLLTGSRTLQPSEAHVRFHATRHRAWADKIAT
jgi:hypothetical protein